VFQLELEEYAREGVVGANITYVDNKPLLVRPRSHLSLPVILCVVWQFWFDAP
jgi:hypothetical protein